MRLGEVCLLTNHVAVMSNFYKSLLQVNNNSDDEGHQTIIAEETMLTVQKSEIDEEKCNATMCIAFTVDDIDAEYQRLLKMGVRIVEPPTKRPYGTINMSIYDPDGNVVYLRQLLK